MITVMLPNRDIEHAEGSILAQANVTFGRDRTHYAYLIGTPDGKARWQKWDSLASVYDDYAGPAVRHMSTAEVGGGLPDAVQHAWEGPPPGFICPPIRELSVHDDMGWELRATVKVAFSAGQWLIVDD